MLRGCSDVRREVLSHCLSQLQRSEGADEPVMWELNTAITRKCCQIGQTLHQKSSLCERIKKLVNRLSEERDALIYQILLKSFPLQESFPSNDIIEFSKYFGGSGSNTDKRQKPLRVCEDEVHSAEKVIQGNLQQVSCVKGY